MNVTNDKISVLKSNMILGGAQVVQMVVTILRAKIIAVALGSAGLGINAILQSMLLTLNNVSSLGVFQSGVREISVNEGNPKTQNKVVAIVIKLVLICGILGFVITALFSPLLSYISFGGTSKWLTFVVLGIGVSFYTLTHGEMTILQGLRKNIFLAKSSIVGAVLSLLVCIPCYCLCGQDGVVIAIVLSYMVFHVVYKRYRKKALIYNEKISFAETIKEGKPIVSLGIYLMIGTFMVSLFTYLTNVSIRLLGDINDVGLYQGAASLATQSIVVITAVLATDFFPRLSSTLKNTGAKILLINEQIKLVILLITPIIALIICFSDFFVEVLLSKEFLVVSPLLQCMALGLIFRGLWILMSYVILSHGDRKSYIIFDALLGNGFCYIITVVAYKMGGLNYLGIAYVLSSVVVFLVLSGVVCIKYCYKMNKWVMAYMLISVIMVAIIYFLSMENNPSAMILSSVIVVFSIYFLIKEFGLLKILKIQK